MPPDAGSNENAVARAGVGPLTQRVLAKKSNGAVAGMVLLTVFLWGASNAGTKYVVTSWPPIFVGSTRFLGAGAVLLALLRWTTWLGRLTPLTRKMQQDLWLRGGLSLAVYIVVFNWAVKYTSASHVALMLGASPVWALIWEERPEWSWRSAQRYGAAGLAVLGVVVLFWPALRAGSTRWFGELLGLAASLMWTVYGRQAKALGVGLSGVEVSAHVMWRAGLMLLPLAAVELMATRGIEWRASLAWVQFYCLVGGGVLAYALWNDSLRHWRTSKVLLFTNLVPLSTMGWSWLCLGEAVTPTFWAATALIAGGVMLGQGNWEKVLGRQWMPAE
jgi:drug/metabolite transporter (DMT)-like permease